MFYVSDLNETPKEDIRINDEELYSYWQTRHMNGEVRLDGRLAANEQSKFKTVCSLRFIQMLHKNQDSELRFKNMERQRG
ncbi:MAG: hypothetical protein LBD73_02815 [Deferribacteraceae bacterium]|jgi:hypothetical protein|nr:hypothetical protein [Deferribacteraceae bacterium]